MNDDVIEIPVIVAEEALGFLNLGADGVKRFNEEKESLATLRNRISRKLSGYKKRHGKCLGILGDQNRIDELRCLWERLRNYRPECVYFNDASHPAVLEHIAGETLQIYHARLFMTVEQAIERAYSTVSLPLADLANIDLSARNLKGIDLKRVNLSGANLKEANLEQAILWNTSLEKSHLQHANLTQVPDIGNFRMESASQCLRNVSFVSSRLEGANLSDGDFSGCDFSDAVLVDANLSHSDFDHAAFTRADLSNTNMTQSKLTNVDFTNAILVGATLSGSDLDKSDIDDTNI